MGDTYKVSVQGIDQDLTKATGEYDSYELGGKTGEELQQLLDELKAFEEPGPEESDDDICPPALIVEQGDDAFMFVMNGGTIFSVETGGEVTSDEALAILRDPAVMDEMGQKAREEAAPAPALRQDVAVTDTDKVTAADINTGPQSPQFSLEVWKSGNARSWTFLPPALGGFFIFVGLVAIKEDTGPAVVCLALGIGLCFVRSFIKGWARETLSIGVDWDTNTLWCKRGDKEPSFRPNANRFAELSLEKKKDTETMYQDLDGDGIVEEKSVKVISWVIEGKALDTAIPPQTVHTFLVKKEAEEALRQLKQLYASQGSK